MAILLMGLCTAFNIVIIIYKYRHSRIADATLDLCLLGILASLFSGSTEALCIGTVTSVFISAYLWFRPIILFSSTSKQKLEVEEIEW